MMSIPAKLFWLDRAIEVYTFHISQCKSEGSWTISKTAELLNRSFGSVAQDLMLASWSLVYDKELRKFRSMNDALEFVRKKKREMSIREIS